MAARRKTSWDFSFPSIDGGTLDLRAFAGRVLVVVNTASFCGYTYQYEGLKKLDEASAADGLTVIGVPSQDFNQESPDNKTVKTFCETRYGVDFPLAGVSHVKGPAAAPFYAWVRETAVVGARLEFQQSPDRARRRHRRNVRIGRRAGGDEAQRGDLGGLGRRPRNLPRAFRAPRRRRFTSIPRPQMGLELGGVQPLAGRFLHQFIEALHTSRAHAHCCAASSSAATDRQGPSPSSTRECAETPQRSLRRRHRAQRVAREIAERPVVPVDVLQAPLRVVRRRNAQKVLDRAVPGTR